MKNHVLHCDMNNYFASVECLYSPELRSVPFAVCGDPKARHGIVLAKNYLAKSYGIVTGESMYEAKKKCHNLVTSTPNYDRYLKYAKLSRKIYSEYSNTIIPYGLDEAWIELPNTTLANAITTANEIKNRIKNELLLTISIGVSFNYIFSKLGSDMKKPDAITVIPENSYKDIIWNLPAFDLLFVGNATRKKLYKLGILSIGDLAKSDPLFLDKYLGKNGINLWNFANGDDRNFVLSVKNNDEIKSIGNTITPPNDILTNDEVVKMLYLLSSTVSTRLRRHGLFCSSIGINIKNSEFETTSRCITFKAPTDNVNTIYIKAYDLFCKHHNWEYNVRSLGVAAQKLSDNSFMQISLFNTDDELDDKTAFILRNLSYEMHKYKLEQNENTI